MIQINNGFCDYYYLTEEGFVFNADTNNYLKPDNNRYRLKTITGETRDISRKKLYRLVYNQELCADNIQNLTGEEWRVIPQTNSKYYVSNKGRVKSYCGYEAIILQPLEQKGYERVRININNSLSNRLVHRLVAQCFLKQPMLDMELHHKDGNRRNNCVENLQWLTPKEHRDLHKKLNTKEE